MRSRANAGRREFLAATGLAAAAAAAAVVANGRKGATDAGVQAQQPQPSGYHATEHILKYYDTAKI